MNCTIAQQDPWQKYENQGRKKPVVPEPGYAGALIALAIVGLYLLRRTRR